MKPNPLFSQRSDWHTLFGIILLVIWTMASRADVVIPFGTQPGQVAYINQTSHPREEIPVPYGPRAFRIIGDDCWIIDTVGGKLLRYDLTKGFKNEWKIVTQPREMIFEDLTPILATDRSIRGWWTIDLISSSLIRLNAFGRIIQRIQSPEFVQPFRVEVGARGQVFLADKGAKAVFQVDSRSSTVIRKIAWEWSGLGIGDKTHSLYLLRFSPGERTTVLVGIDTEGRQRSRIALVLPPHFNPELQWVNEERGECVLTYVIYAPHDPRHGQTVAVRCGLDGRIKGSMPVKLPFYLHRYLDRFGGRLYLAEADYAAAPAGNLCIKRFFLP